MKAAVLSTGTELVRGELINSNAAWLGAALWALGVEVTEHVVVGDDSQKIVDALLRLRAHNDWIVCTGGLGPTTDDLTAACAAQAFGSKIARNEQAYAQVAARIAAYGRTEISAANAKQAALPLGAEVLENLHGTAPGFACSLGAHTAFFLPGPPREMKPMFEQHLAPRARLRAKRTQVVDVLHTFGVPESILGEKISPLEAEFPGLIVGYRARVPVVDVKLQVIGNDEESATAVLRLATARARALLGDSIYAENGVSLADAVLKVFAEAGKTLAFAESCTGGRAGALMTAPAGSSAVFLGSAVTYSNHAKSSLLDVDPRLIDAHGAVSEQVAQAMAEGVRARTGADIAVSISGIAGPGGGSADKPVGTVCFGISSAAHTSAIRRHLRMPDRERIQDTAAHIALLLARDELMRSLA